MRKWMPNSIGGLIWAGLGEGATVAHVPFYAGTTRTPEAYAIGEQKERPSPSQMFSGSMYDERSAYWTYRVISNLVNLFYTATKEHVIPVWDAWEDELYKQQPQVEKAALELYREDPGLAVEFITGYGCWKATEALDIAKTMTGKLHTIIAHYNSPL